MIRPVMAPDTISTTAPGSRAGVRLVQVGDEAVLVDGWDLAMVLNATGAMIWSRLDGHTTVHDLASALAEEAGADPDQVARDVAAFVELVGRAGVLDGVDGLFADDTPEAEITLVPVAPVREGSVIAPQDCVDEAGRPVSLLRADGGQRLLVKWNPHCGYCAAIAGDLDEVLPTLRAGGIDLLLVCAGAPEPLQQAVAAAKANTGIDLPVVFVAESDPFPSVGTPSAYHVDGNGTVRSPTAHGADEVPLLAAKLAGVDLDARRDETGAQIRYLRRRGGMCAPDTAAAAGDWAATRTYRIGEYHVGVRVDSEATGAVLDRLLPGARVADDRAGHSYSVSLPDSATWLESRHPASGPQPPVASGGVRRLNTFVSTGGSGVLRSRDPARVLRALLTCLGDELVETTLADGLVRVNARAVVIDGEAVLLPAAFDSLGPRLQPELAQAGAAPVDVTHPLVDLRTAELVMQEPLVHHDPDLLAEMTDVADASALLGPNTPERPAVLPGRYPLRAWCAIRQGPSGVTELTPAEAAAATVSTVFDSEDPAQRVAQLGELFTGGASRGLALWYDDKRSLFATIESAVTWQPDAAGAT